MSADTTNVPYNPYYDLETGVQHGSDRVNDPSATKWIPAPKLAISLRYACNSHAHAAAP